jgi:hypothetical protein
VQLGNFILFVILFLLRDFAGLWALLLLGYKMSIEKKVGG